MNKKLIFTIILTVFLTGCATTASAQSTGAELTAELEVYPANEIIENELFSLYLNLENHGTETVENLTIKTSGISSSNLNVEGFSCLPVCPLEVLTESSEGLEPEDVISEALIDDGKLHGFFTSTELPIKVELTYDYIGLIEGQYCLSLDSEICTSGEIKYSNSVSSLTTDVKTTVSKSRQKTYYDITIRNTGTGEVVDDNFNISMDFNSDDLKCSTSKITKEEQYYKGELKLKNDSLSLKCELPIPRDQEYQKEFDIALKYKYKIDTQTTINVLSGSGSVTTEN